MKNLNWYLFNLNSGKTVIVRAQYRSDAKVKFESTFSDDETSRIVAEGSAESVPSADQILVVEK